MYENLDPLVEREMAILLAMEIDFQLKLEQLKQDLEKFKKFSIRRAFKAIDSANFRYLDEVSIRRFLKKIGHKPLKGELIAIMRRFDLDGDAKISFQEFVEALTPVQPDIIRNPLRNYPERRNRSVSRHSYRDELMTATINEEVNERDNKRDTNTIEWPSQNSQRKRSIGNYEESAQIYCQDFGGVQQPRDRSPDAKALPQYHQTRFKRVNKSADKIHKQPVKRRTAKKQSAKRGDNSLFNITSPDRSVTFANKVKVREYGSKSKKRGKSAENSHARMNR